MADPVKKTETTSDVRDVTPIRKVAAGATNPLRLVDPFTEMERIFEGFFPRGRSRPSRLRILIIVSADYYDREHCAECVGAGVGIVSSSAHDGSRFLSVLVVFFRIDSPVSNSL